MIKQLRLLDEADESPKAEARKIRAKLLREACKGEGLRSLLDAFEKHEEKHKHEDDS